MKPTLEEQVEAAFTSIIKALGENPYRTGLLETPKRMGKAYAEMFRGYRQPNFSMTTFPATDDGMIIKKGIPFTAYCEHHFAPFTGTIDFGYIPNESIIGISKITRLFQHIASKLHIQENMTVEMIEYFCSIVKPKGAIIVIKAVHSCESNRGVKVPNVPTITSAIRGIFTEEKDLEQKFYTLSSL